MINTASVLMDDVDAECVKAEYKLSMGRLRDTLSEYEYGLVIKGFEVAWKCAYMLIEIRGRGLQ